MSIATFVVEVHQGRIDVPIPKEFEGRRVKVTVEEATPDARAVEEADVLEDCGRIDLPPRDVTTVKARIIDVPARPMPVYSEEEYVVGGELDDCGRIDLPPRDVTTVKFRFVDVGRQPMRDYAEDECEIVDD